VSCLTNNYAVVHHDLLDQHEFITKVRILRTISRFINLWSYILFSTWHMLVPDNNLTYVLQSEGAGGVGGRISKSIITQFKCGWLIVKLSNPSMTLGCWSSVPDWSLHGLHGEIGLHLICSHWKILLYIPYTFFVL